MPQINGPEVSQNDTTLNLRGPWTTRYLRTLPESLEVQQKTTLLINASEMTTLDTAGALLINHYLAQLKTQKIKYELQGFKPEWKKLLDFVSAHPAEKLPSALPRLGFFAGVGKETINKGLQFFHFFDFIGRITHTMGQAFRQPRRFHFRSIVNVMEQTGLDSLPIVALLCFLIGFVLAYQIGIQLKNYGANIFIVYLSGISILREFGPLITAIILAGRTSSAFTAEIGSMKVNQEIDAILTMGLQPNEFLVIPKIIGLLIIFPLLIFWADLFGILGSMLMAKMSLDIKYGVFLHEFAESVEIKQLLIGLSKAPAFALIIALIGCYQGLQVESSADSIGKKTTKSVVQAIFLIIIADAAFSVLYSMLRI